MPGSPFMEASHVLSKIAFDETKLPDLPQRMRRAVFGLRSVGLPTANSGETPAASTPTENVHTWKCFACGGEYVGDDHLKTLEHKRKMGALWVDLATGEGNEGFREYAKQRLCLYAYYEPDHPVFESVQLCGSPANGSWSSRINLPSTTREPTLP